MSFSRLKTLVIAALALINVFFLITIAVGQAQDVAERRRIAEGTRAALEMGGISVECELRMGTPRLYNTARDMYAEARIVTAALGECTLTNLPGGVSRYDGERGTAQFNALGDFVINFPHGYPSADAKRTAESMLRGMRIDTGAVTVGISGTDETAVAPVLHRGGAVVNCRVTFEFADGQLTRVTGTCASGVTEAAEPRTLYDMQTLMMAFLASVKRGDIECERILSVEQAYRYAPRALGAGELVPGWVIETDSGVWFADAAAGRVEAV